MAEMPILMQILFGEMAETAWRGASERLRWWCAAFDGWLAERRVRKPSTVKPARQAWQRLLGHVRKMPWELGEEDIAQHAGWMVEQGYSPATAANDVGLQADFFRWCDERRIDAECEAGFNPAAGVKRPKVGRYRRASLLSREEVGRLLRVMGADPSPLGVRDYAFTLARLRLGVPLSHLQKLQWGQIEVDAERAWVRWRTGEVRQRLPDEVWEAIRAAMEAGGRLEGILAEDYIFAPLTGPTNGEMGSKAEDWLAGGHLSTSQLSRNLKLYGRLAGIAEEKLTLHALRRTATRLRLEENASPENQADIMDMQEFLDSREDGKFTKHRLKQLPRLPEDEENMDHREDDAVRVPRRTMKPFQPGEGMTHGRYMHSLPAEQVRAVMNENIRGIEEQIVGLRTLGRKLLEAQVVAANRQEAAQLIEAYSLAAYREGEMIKAEEVLANRGKEDQWAVEVMEVLKRMSSETGCETDEAEPGTELQELDETSRQLREEVASMRWVLRNAFRLAMEAEETGELVRMAGIYGSCCVRLVRLLRLERDETSQLARELDEAISQVLKELAEEYGWVNEKEGML